MMGKGRYWNITNVHAVNFKTDTLRARHVHRSVIANGEDLILVSQFVHTF